MIKNISFSKTMSYILRYSCSEFNLIKDEEGYIDINDFLIAVKRNFPKATIEDIIYWSQQKNKNGQFRFTIKDNKIKANYIYKDKK